MKSIRAQHEMVGFMLIVVIVSVIGVIFLSFTLGRGEALPQTHIEISNLLQSAMHYTSDCAVNFIPQYKDGQDLIKSCYRNERCLDGRTSCAAMNDTFQKIIGESLSVDEKGLNKAYSLNMYYQSIDEGSISDPLLNISEGRFTNCTSQVGGNHALLISSIGTGTIFVELDVCRG
jgi:hypothetical protein